MLGRPVGPPRAILALACPAMLAVNWLSPRDLIETFGTIGLILVVFVESGLLPVPLPGDSILVLAGAFSRPAAHSKDPHLNLAAVVIGSFVAAVLGAQIGYAIGRHYGVRLFKPHAPPVQDRVPRAGSGLLRPARAAIGRARALHPVRADGGADPRRYRAHARGRFAISNVIGAALWTVGISLLGFWLGKSIDIDKYIYPIIVVIIVASLIPPFLEYRKHRRSKA